MYARLKNGVVDSIQGKPKWYKDDGTQVDDEALFIEDGIYPVIDIIPQYNFRIETCVQNPMAEWIINSDHVATTYTVSPMTLEAAVIQMRQLINDLRYSKIYQASIPYLFPGDTEEDGVQMRDEADRQNIQDIIIDANLKDPTEVMYFMPVSNNLKLVTAADMIAMGVYLKARGDAIVGYAWQLKSSLGAITDINEIVNFNINDGWPY
jgi:hypothetical protein